MLVTLFLVQMELLKSANALVANSMTALSFFALISLVFVMLAFVEYAVILLVERIQKFRNVRYTYWNADIVDFVSMVGYFLLLIIFNISFALDVYCQENK